MAVSSTIMSVAETSNHHKIPIEDDKNRHKAEGLLVERDSAAAGTTGLDSVIKAQGSGIMTPARDQGSRAVCEVLCQTEPPPSYGARQRDEAALHSRFTQRIRRRYATEYTLLPPGIPDLAGLRLAHERLLAQLQDMGASLRVLRALTLERLLTLDCESDASLAAITQTMTTLAEYCVQQALQVTHAQLVATHGKPLLPSGEDAAMWIVGMGKLGARELNVSSDIDLIALYEDEGETQGNAEGRGRITHHEFCARLVRMLSTMLADVTEHGQVFRVDWALRPNGQSGPAAVSLPALEDYFITVGREWERFAWLKGRTIAWTLDKTRAHALRDVVTPFVFRRYLDYNVFESLRSLHRQIRDHASKRAAGRPERANDVKLSRGGIREIEFIVQLLQVVRGGQFPELRTRPTLSALERLVAAKLMPRETADKLGESYVFLRRVEHRIQYLDDQQTHVLPTRDDDLAWIAHTMGLSGVCELLARLDAHRELVAGEFDTLLGEAQPCKGCNGNSPAAPDAASQALSHGLPDRLRERLEHWQQDARVQNLKESSRERLMRLAERSIQWLREGRTTEEAVVRLADWMESLLRRESYFALLLERPAVHERLLRVLGSARWPARYLMKHPSVIDELARETWLDEALDVQQIEAELDARERALRHAGQDDDEALMGLLRRAQHAAVFQVLVRDVEQRITVEQVADELSALADMVLRVTTRWVWARLKIRHRGDPAIALIGYGKLGGKELGYGSDLDIVCLYDDEHEQAASVYSAFIRKLITWLSTKTAEGDLYDVDTALRPNGSSGLLVTSLTAFSDYQTQRGSNTAWTWEHQAMTRARCVLGSSVMQQAFESVRQAVLVASRDGAALRSEILAMRERVRSAHPVAADRFDVKHSAGGMMDVEFAVQYLVLSQSAAHPELQDNVGNIALLRRAEETGLLPTGVGHAAADAYRELRRLQHTARLNEAPTQLSLEAAAPQRAAVSALWQAVFGPT
jgi:[glutamine synthetase] adenylyltransferase / [glutamine synthetase]-adenylyl-L-tyrosine phosphorylase